MVATLEHATNHSPSLMDGEGELSAEGRASPRSHSAVSENEGTTPNQRMPVSESGRVLSTSAITMPSSTADAVDAGPSQAAALVQQITSAKKLSAIAAKRHENNLLSTASQYMTSRMNDSVNFSPATNNCDPFATFVASELSELQDKALKEQTKMKIQQVLFAAKMKQWTTPNKRSKREVDDSLFVDDSYSYQCSDDDDTCAVIKTTSTPTIKPVITGSANITLHPVYRSPTSTTLQDPITSAPVNTSLLLPVTSSHGSTTLQDPITSAPVNTSLLPPVTSSHGSTTLQDPITSAPVNTSLLLPVTSSHGSTTLQDPITSVPVNTSLLPPATTSTYTTLQSATSDSPSTMLAINRSYSWSWANDQPWSQEHHDQPWSRERYYPLSHQHQPWPHDHQPWPHEQQQVSAWSDGQWYNQADYDHHTAPRGYSCPNDQRSTIPPAYGWPDQQAAYQFPSFPYYTDTGSQKKF
jgi:hypothetical protein